MPARCEVEGAAKAGLEAVRLAHRANKPAGTPGRLCLHGAKSKGPRKRAWRPCVWPTGPISRPEHRAGFACTVRRPLSRSPPEAWGLDFKIFFVFFLFVPRSGFPAAGNGPRLSPRGRSRPARSLPNRGRTRRCPCPQNRCRIRRRTPRDRRAKRARLSIHSPQRIPCRRKWAAPQSAR